MRKNTFFKLSLLVLSTLAFGFGCKTAKKVQTIQSAITRKDTAQTVVISDAPKVDSAAIVKELVGKVAKSKINFNTFNAKIKVTYESAENSDNYTAYLSMQKDSMILIKIAGKFLGISKVGLQARITKDSVALVKMVQGASVSYQSISYLQDVTQIPFDFNTLQDLIIGNPVFIDGNIVSYKNGPSQLLVLIVGDLFKHLLSIDNNSGRILHSKLDDADLQRNRTCDITFSNYQPLDKFQFAAYRKISVAEKSKLDIYLDFKEFSLNEPLKYAFDIPKRIKRK
jgi:hypothetical protein